MENNIKKKMASSIVFFKAGKNDKSIALTFDDGPFPEHTDKILDTLNRFNVKATFFLIGSQVEKFPETAKKIMQAGHELGMHSYSHKNLTKMNFFDLLNDIKKSLGVYREILGIKPKLLRAPFGAINAKVVLAALLSGLRLVQWSVDLKDSFIKVDSQLWEKVEKVDFQGGDVVLLHEDSSAVVSLLGELIEHIRKAGFSLQTIGYMMKGSK